MGPRGERWGLGWTGDQTRHPASVCLSVAGQTCPSCLGQSSRNFRWWLGLWSAMFISGTGPIGQVTGEKRAGNSKFVRLVRKVLRDDNVAPISSDKIRAHDDFHSGVG